MDAQLKRIITLIEGYNKTKNRYLSAEIDKFRNLLAGYQRLRLFASNRLTAFLEEFKQKNEEYTKTTIEKFENLLTGYEKVFKEYRKKQENTAEELNILDVLDFTYDELRHSRFLSFLLDPLESHAQGNLFFRVFLEATHLPIEYAQLEYVVKPEVKYNESRIDIEMRSKKGGERGFIIHIENKVGAAPYRDQIERENRDLLRAADAMCIPDERRHGFLLCREKPQDDLLAGTLFKWIGWDKIINCLESFVKGAHAERAKWAAEQYLKCIRDNILREISEEKEVRNAEIERD